ncbi:MAG: pimeloyl-CoA dehydrogenase small subunit [Alphaproteobacteria bacterium]|jgi:alkylation response protein AidB-like acyl-CoA dehydrogenase|nr:pimeloyl-CoA dehydrogenase small subunit [Alphaproteobacteria bacterium]MBT4082599.1 pimeloyl-CoA dehydrogenase small subunit [Alphaproteobacteria bacterium]MBT4545861.1 pimeloyl-CoA dehydrogenase small subunit [Alphaproteobacteria bacterium]MBT7746366.1 pimeloyl-CoA dehydrogenase small subunit [Alphaproteobacteria bacterium]
MDFGYSEEQVLFSNSLQKLLSDSYNVDVRRALVEDGPGYSEDVWKAFAEMGLLALPFPEDMGGFDGTSVDTMVVAIELGRHLALEPYVPTVVMAGSALKLAGSDAQKTDLIAKIISGDLKMAVALTEPGSRFDMADVTTRAVANGDDYIISGSKSVVLGGDLADKIIVSVRTSGDTRSEDGLTLFIVDANADGVSRETYSLLDGRGGADIHLENVRVPASAVLGTLDQAWSVMEHVADQASAALCAESLGAFEKVNELTLEYLKVREQFGRPIGKFQVLQHHMADMVIEYEHARSLVCQSSMKADSEDAAERGKAVSSTKVYLGEGGHKSCQSAIQLHGGIGMTAEYELGDFVKRMAISEVLFGDVDHHLVRFGKLSYLD